MSNAFRQKSTHTLNLLYSLIVNEYETYFSLWRRCRWRVKFDVVPHVSVTTHLQNLHFAWCLFPPVVVNSLWSVHPITRDTADMVMLVRAGQVRIREVSVRSTRYKPSTVALVQLVHKTMYKKILTESQKSVLLLTQWNWNTWQSRALDLNGSLFKGLFSLVENLHVIDRK